MKKYILTLILILFYSQDNYSQSNDYTCIFVNYKLKVTNEIENENELKEEKTKKIIDQVGKDLESIDYGLYVKNNSSIYFKLDKLDIKENSITQRLASRLGGRGVYYKNINKNLKFIQKESLGKLFNIIQPLTDNWVITKETKIIQGYTCYKATCERTVTNYLTGTKSVFTPSVWFTLDIPIPFGPKGLDGLPGLVLEGTINGKTTLYASKIDFNTKECLKIIKKPTKGTDILKDDYDKLMAKKRMELKQ